MDVVVYFLSCNRIYWFPLVANKPPEISWLIFSFYVPLSMHLIVFMFLIILKILTYIFPWFRSIWWCCTLCVCWDKSLLNLGCDEKEQHLIHDVKILKMSNIYAHNISKDRLTCFHLEPSLVCTTYVPGRFLNLQYDLPYTFTLNVLKHQTQKQLEEYYQVSYRKCLNEDKHI